MERTVGSKSEGFQLVIRSDGSYLTVYPQEVGSPGVEIGSLKEKMKEAGVTDFDALQLARLVRAADGVETRTGISGGAATQDGAQPHVQVWCVPDHQQSVVVR